MQHVKSKAKALASALLKRKCGLVTDETDNRLLLLDLTALGLVGAPTMTWRGCLEEDFETITDFLLKEAQITNIVKREYRESCKDFLKGLQNKVNELRNQVDAYTSQVHDAKIQCLI